MKITSLFFILALITLCPAFAIPQSGLRKVDFKNFTYSPACGEEKKLTVKDGEYMRGTPGDPSSDLIYFTIVEVIYGDLTGDGAEEAIVLTLCNTGGTGQFTDGIIFTMLGGKPVEVGRLGVGDRAYGGIDGVAIENGILKISRYATVSGGACCPEYVETTAYKLSGNKLIQVGKSARKKIDQADSAPPTRASRIRFARGRTSAVVTGSTQSSEEYLIGARAGQTMTLRITSKENNAEVEVLGPRGDRVQGTEGPGQWSGALPESGDYVIRVRAAGGTASYRLEVTIR
jgi:hypothetical protein